MIKATGTSGKHTETTAPAGSQADEEQRPAQAETPP
jgi:hypothetical protein